LTLPAAQCGRRRFRFGDPLPAACVPPFRPRRFFPAATACSSTDADAFFDGVVSMPASCQCVFAAAAASAINRRDRSGEACPAASCIPFESSPGCGYGEVREIFFPVPDVRSGGFRSRSVHLPAARR